ITFRDITRRRNADAELKSSELRFRTIFEQAGFGMTLFNMRGGFLASNPAFCRMSGYTEEELTKINIAEISATSETTPINKTLLEDMQLGKIDSFELDKSYRRKDG